VEPMTITSPSFNRYGIFGSTSSLNRKTTLIKN
jgi:hypothetical protein